MKLLGAFILAPLLGFATAAAPSVFGSDAQPTARTLPRHQYHGFSVKPPTSAGWFVKVSEQTHERATYRRTLATPTHTFVASVVLGALDRSIPLEDALSPHGIADSDRVKVLENSHEPDNSRKTTCIRYSIHFKDRGAPNSPNAELDLIERGFVCAHPTIPGALVRASFSERGLEGELDPGLWSELEDFLRDVHIESAPGVSAA